MTRIVAFDDVVADRVEKTGKSGKTYRRTSFVTPEGDDDPQVYLIENSPRMTIGSHFHDVDQFQIFVGGDGRLGQTEVAPVSIHFARAFTTYGPIETRDQGLAWMTLRPRRDLGARMIDEHREALERNAARRPWQTTIPSRFPAADAAGVAPALALLTGDHGLAATAITLAPGQTMSAPDPSTTPCQYILLTHGSLIHDGVEKSALAVVHVAPTDAPFRLVAGPRGLSCLVLGFPDPARAAATEAAAGKAVPSARPAADAVWHCELCGFVYDEADGLPSQGIAAGTRWHDVPDTFRCPDCAAEKQDFTPLAL